MSKFDKFKKWYSLEDAAKRLATFFDDDISVKDVLRICCDEHMPLSMMLRNAGVISPVEYCPLANSFQYIHDAAEQLDELWCLDDLRYGSRYEDDLDECFSLYNTSMAPHLPPPIHPIHHSRVEAIKKLAEGMYLDSVICWVPGARESSLPEYVTSLHGRISLRITEQTEIKRFDGVYQVILNEIQREALMDTHVICNEELLTEDYEDADMVILDHHGAEYKLIYGIDGGESYLFESEYLFQTGIPPLNSLVIQTKHLLEFERNQINNDSLPESEDLLTNKPHRQSDVFDQFEEAVKRLIRELERLPTKKETFAELRKPCPNMDKDAFGKNWRRYTGPAPTK